MPTDQLPTGLIRGMQRPWNLGNTTVRSPFRLQAGLEALQASQLEGNLEGRSQEIFFSDVLAERGVVQRVGPGEDDYDSVGRKWRSALAQLGFIAPKQTNEYPDADLPEPFTITKNGRRLLQAESVPAMQESFLRALRAVRLPSVVEPYHGIEAAPFSPLLLLIRVMISLERNSDDPVLRRQEFELFVQGQYADSWETAQDTVQRIERFRKERQRAASKKSYENRLYSALGARIGRKEGTLRDYGDSNLRYLKATGLFAERGRGIALLAERRALTEHIGKTDVPELDDLRYLYTLTEGAALPTDDATTGREVLDDLRRQAQEWGVKFDLTGYDLSTAAGINIARHNLDEQVLLRKEEKYASEQSGQVEEILQYLKALSSRRLQSGAGESRISIPRDEAPAYFEWTVWRAFLALNYLHNRAHEARSFAVDQDFRPIGHAPGGRPDLIFEFEHFVLVVEVTLTENSRQEAAEGESVRRHVAVQLEEYRGRTGKPTFGLFLARRLDLNTIETFRHGVWYLPDETRLELSIVPMKLEDFVQIFKRIIDENLRADKELLPLIERVGQERAGAIDAPAWRGRIDAVYQEFPVGAVSKA